MTLLSPSFTPKLITTFREGYGAARFKADVVAGLTVAIVALPLSMALGIASGASPDKGLVTAIIAGFVISALGGSRVQVGGPTGAFVVVISGIIAQHGYAGLVLATLFAGAILIAAGYAGVGKLMKYIPMPVITGFTAGIAVIIASSQIADFLGLRAEHIPAEFFAKWGVYISAIGTTNLAALAIGAGALAIILVLKKLAPRWPGYLIALTIASMAVAFLHMPVETVGLRFPNMPSSVPSPHIPAFSMAMARDIIGPAFTIAFLAGIEALLSATVADGMTGYRHRSGQELVGQGAANIASALFGGLPATGALARTATNIRAGAQTPMAGVFHAGFLLLFLLIAGPLIAYIPMAALAAVLLIVAWGMSEIDRFRALMRMNVGERTLLLLTFGLTIMVDLTVAIGVGVTLASLLFMARMSEAAGVEHTDSAQEDPDQRARLPKGVEVFRLAGPLFFGAAREMLDALTRIGRTPDVVILRLAGVSYIDSSGIDMIADFARQAAANDTRVIVCELRPSIAKELERASPPYGGAQVSRSFEEALSMLNGKSA